MVENQETNCQENSFSLFDFETMRLAHYMALRSLLISNDPLVVEFYVNGAEGSRRKRSESIKKLLQMGYLEVEKRTHNMVDAKVTLTQKGKLVFQNFLEAEENGSLEKIKVFLAHINEA